MRWETVKEIKNNAGFIHEIKCSKCGHKETVPAWVWPRACYVCDEEDDLLGAKNGDMTA